MKKTSIVLIILLILVFCFGNYIPLNLKWHRQVNGNMAGTVKLMEIWPQHNPDP
ncbi:hypothetical protein [Candidatus Bandiella numerosa]|uniref:hypothetical protein n=1 Tax=Candidatus Bandiella numerosa TaxID=2570586 RepID=UPI001F27BE73|nr:hypothetical protein [Candidatus Bandiella numerosa]